MLTPSILSSLATEVVGDRADAPSAGRGEPFGATEDEVRVIDLVDRAKEGSATAFAELYDRYVDRIYGFVLRRVGDPHLAEDLTAEVFTRALRRIDTFTFEGVDPIAWLLTIARNRVHDHHRSARFRLDSQTSALQTDVVDDRPAPGAALERAVVVTEVRSALTRLKPAHAEVLHLRFVEELNVAETAAVLKMKDGAVRALQFRALKALAKHVDVEAVT